MANRKGLVKVASFSLSSLARFPILRSLAGEKLDERGLKRAKLFVRGEEILSGGKGREKQGGGARLFFSRGENAEERHG